MLSNVLKKRTLKLEQLENRELLSATTWDAPSQDADAVVALQTVATSTEAEPIDLASLVVTTQSSEVDETDGVLSLAEAIAQVADGGTITFDESLKGQKFDFGYVELDKAITIDASALYDAETGAPGVSFSTTQATLRGAGSLSIVGVGIENIYLFWEDAQLTDGAVLLKDCALSNIYISNSPSTVETPSCGGSATFVNCDFSGGSQYFSGLETTTLTNCSVVGGYGLTSDSLNFEATNCEFTNAKATALTFSPLSFEGGEARQTASLTNCLIANNADYLAVDVRAYDAFSLTLTNCTVTENGSTRYPNSSAAIKGYYRDGGDCVITLRNTIVAGNRGADVTIEGQPEETTENATSVLAYNTLSSFTAWTNAETDAATQYVYDASQPLFLDGGYFLAYGSQALDLGNNAFLAETQTTDLAGNPRVGGTVVDLGAYEYKAPEVPSTVVTTTADVSDAFDGEISLREALAYAQNGDVVTFDASLKGETFVLAGNALSVDKSLKIKGFVDENGAPQIAVDANEASAVFYCAKAVSFEGLKITGGRGGVIANDTASFKNVEITGNVGTGVTVYGSHEIPATFENVKITDNQADYGEGGGVCVNGAATFANVEISGNFAMNGGGVALYGSYDAPTTFTNVKIFDNVAGQYGGGVCVYGGENVSFTNVEITGNTSGGVYDGSTYYGRGGGVYVDSCVNLSVENATISDNTSNSSGGGLYITNVAATLTNVEMVDNEASNGGAVAIYGTTEATFTRATLAGNVSTSQSGYDVYIYYKDSVATFLDSIVLDAIGGSGAAKASYTLSNYGAWANAETDAATQYVHNASQPLFTDAENGDYSLAKNSQAIGKASDGGDLGFSEDWASVEEARTLVVDAANDVVDATDGVLSLREAIAEAKAGDTIVFADDVVKIVLAGEHLTIDKALTIDGGDGVTIDADGKSRVVYVPKYAIYNDVVTFSNLTFTGGNAAASNGGYDAAYGGGLYLGGNAIFNNCVVSGNVAEAAGGGIFLDARLDAELIEEETSSRFYGGRIAENQAGTLGGGLYVSTTSTVTVDGGAVSDNDAKYGGGVFVNGVATATQVEITGNGATVHGGGVYVDVSGNLDASLVAFEKNEAANAGGGVYVDGVAAISSGSIAQNRASVGAGANVGSSGNARFNVNIADNVASNYGGGLRVSGSATVVAGSIYSNSATKFGGGVYVDKVGEIEVSGGKIYGNDANYGGGLFVNGGATLANVEVSGNAARIQGGGLYVDRAGTLEATSVALSANTASTAGGGAYLDGVATFDGESSISRNRAPIGAGANVGIKGTATFTNVAIAANDATNYGGGVRVSGTAFFENSTVGQNEATKFGGGVYVDKTGTVDVAGGSVYYNKAKYGGGFFVNGDATLANVKITDNEATSQGAGMYVDKTGVANAANVEMTKNAASNAGGGVFVDGEATFTNATIADNTATYGAGANVGTDGVATFRNSILADAVRAKGTLNAYNVLSGFTAWTNADETGAVNFVYDASQPLFVDAANGDYRLADGSQALDKGNAEYAVDADGAALTTDLAENARVVGSSVDVGAYERQDAASSARLASEAFADAFDELDFFVDEDDLDALAESLL